MMKKFLHSVNDFIHNSKNGGVRLSEQPFSGADNKEITRERIFLVVLITGLIGIWFRKGLMLGSGESGLPFYHTTKLWELSKYSWTDVPFGNGSVIGSANYPYYAALTFFESIGIPGFLLQALVYWMLFIVGVLSVHKVASMISGNTVVSRLSSSLFYIFNPIVHIAILHRFQYTLTFFYGFMPLALVIYLKGLKERRFSYVVILSLICIVFIPLFIGVPLLEMFFGMLAFLSIFYFFESSDKEKRVDEKRNLLIAFIKRKRDWFAIRYFIAFVGVFCLVHIWWLIPLFLSTSSDLGTGGTLKFFSSLDNVDIFNSISQRLKSVISVFRLFPVDAYSKEESSWGWIYDTIPFVILSFFSIIAFIVGLFKQRQGFLYKYLIIVSLIVMYLMKGSLAPFGGVFLWIFKSFTFLHAFRNPYEKIGVLLPLVMAIPVGFGVALMINFLTRRFNLPKRLITVLFIIIVFPVYAFPIVNGYVFTGGPPPANDMEIGQYVKVPDYYKQAQEWLSSQPGIFRVLVLPIDGEGMTYKWEYGYSGTELMNNLFDQPMISFSSGQVFLPETVDLIRTMLAASPDKIPQLVQMLNVKYILVRDDIDYLDRETDDPKSILRLMEENLGEYFVPVAEFGKLKFFEIKKDSFYPRVFANSGPIYTIDPINSGLYLMPFANSSQGDMFISASVKDPDNAYIEHATKIIVNGARVENIKLDTKKPIDELPYVTTFRENPFYPLVRIKERFELQSQTRNRLFFEVSLLAKRLVELSNSPKNSEALDEYALVLQSLTPRIKQNIPADVAIVNSLLSQRLLLDQVKGDVNDKVKIEKIISDLDQLFVDIRVKSVYPTENELIYRFLVPRDSKFEILVTRDDWEYYYIDPEIKEFDLDGKKIALLSGQLKKDEDNFSLGVYALQKGVHEVSIKYPKTKNLILAQLPEEMELATKDRQIFVKDIPVAKLDKNYHYSIFFEYIEGRGNLPLVALHSDIDPLDKKGERIPRFAKFLERNSYDFGWKKYTALFRPAPSINEISVTFKLLPYGDCKTTVMRPYRRYCDNPGFNIRFLRDSSARIRNLKFEKVFQNSMILRESEPPVKEKNLPEINFEQISPARYKVKVNNVTEPFFLVLSTAFDRGWRAYFTDQNSSKSLLETLSGSEDGELIDPKNHLMVNGFANSWFIEKTGSYELFLEYHPERVFKIGRVLSTVVVLIGIVFLIYQQKRGNHDFKRG